MKNIFKESCFFRYISIIILTAFFFTSVIPSQALAQGVFLPQPGTMIGLSSAFHPALLRGIQISPTDPLYFNFIVDTGDTGLEGEAFKEESTKLIKYFLASLTTPENEFWVNLSPYEKDRIIADALGQTELGRDLLAQDYMLKQLSASLVSPETDLGKKFWDRVYKKAYELYGTTNIPANTFNKIWIVPDEAVVYEQDTYAFVGERHLKVMLEEDYLSQQTNAKRQDLGLTESKNEDIKKIAAASSDVVREVLLPEIEKEVNNGKVFANLRQIFDSVILATWYKKTLKESLLGQVYADKNKIKGVDIEDKAAKEKIYNQYLETFKKGVCNFIKVEKDAVTGKHIPRKYFSGGISSGILSKVKDLVVRPIKNLGNKAIEFFKSYGTGNIVQISARLRAENQREPYVSKPNLIAEDQDVLTGIVSRIELIYSALNALKLGDSNPEIVVFDSKGRVTLKTTNVEDLLNISSDTLIAKIIFKSKHNEFNKMTMNTIQNKVDLTLTFENGRLAVDGKIEVMDDTAPLGYEQMIRKNFYDAVDDYNNPADALSPEAKEAEKILQWFDNNNHTIEGLNILREKSRSLTASELFNFVNRAVKVFEEFLKKDNDRSEKGLRNHRESQAILNGLKESQERLARIVIIDEVLGRSSYFWMISEKDRKNRNLGKILEALDDSAREYISRGTSSFDYQKALTASRAAEELRMRFGFQNDPEKTKKDLNDGFFDALSDVMESQKVYSDMIAAWDMKDLLRQAMQGNIPTDENYKIRKTRNGFVIKGKFKVTSYGPLPGMERPYLIDERLRVVIKDGLIKNFNYLVRGTRTYPEFQMTLVKDGIEIRQKENFKRIYFPLTTVAQAKAAASAITVAEAQQKAKALVGQGLSIPIVVAIDEKYYPALSMSPYGGILQQEMYEQYPDPEGMAMLEATYDLLAKVREAYPILSSNDQKRIAQYITIKLTRTSYATKNVDGDKTAEFFVSVKFDKVPTSNPFLEISKEPLAQAKVKKLIQQKISAKELPGIVQNLIITMFLRDIEFAKKAAKYQNDAYYIATSQPIPEFITEQDTPADINRKVGQNLAGFTALIDGISNISEETKQTPFEVLDGIVNGQISDANPEMLRMARFAHATWLAGQPFIGIQRLERPVVQSAQTLSPADLEKDFVQIRSAAKFFYDELQKVIKNIATEEDRAEVENEVNKIFAVIAKNTALPAEEEARLKKAVETVVFFHRNDVRKGGSEFSFHPLSVMALNRGLFDNVSTAFDVVALFHDVREDQPVYYEALKNYAALKLQYMPAGSEKEAKTQRESFLRLAIRLLSNFDDSKYAWISEDADTRTYMIQADPEKYFPPQKGQDWYTDEFVRGIQTIKMSDVVNNWESVREIFDNKKELTEKDLAFPTKFFSKITEKMIPILVQGSKVLTKEDKEKFYDRLIIATKKYATELKGVKYQPLIDAAKVALPKLEELKKTDLGTAGSAIVEQTRKALQSFLENREKLFGREYKTLKTKIDGFSDLNESSRIVNELILYLSQNTTRLIEAGLASERDEAQSKLYEFKNSLKKIIEGENIVLPDPAVVELKYKDYLMPPGSKGGATEGYTDPIAEIYNNLIENGYDHDEALKIAMTQYGAGELKEGSASSMIIQYNRPEDQRKPDAKSAVTGYELSKKLIESKGDFGEMREKLGDRDMFVWVEIMSRGGMQVYWAMREFERKIPNTDISSMTGEGLIRFLEERGALSEKKFLVDGAENQSPTPTSDSGDPSYGVSSSNARSDQLGGIDLGAAGEALQIKRDGNGMPLPLNQQSMEFQNIEGFTPFIINVTPFNPATILSQIEGGGESAVSS